MKSWSSENEEYVGNNDFQIRNLGEAGLRFHIRDQNFQDNGDKVLFELPVEDLKLYLQQALSQNVAETGENIQVLVLENGNLQFQLKKESLRHRDGYVAFECHATNFKPVTE